MSKFKKKTVKFFKVELGKTLEEQLSDYLKDVDPIADPWDDDVKDTSKSNLSQVSYGDEFYDSLMELYINVLD